MYTYLFQFSSVLYIHFFQFNSISYLEIYSSSILFSSIYYYSLNVKRKWNTNVLTVCSYHVTYTFQSESTLYSCLNVKELLAQSRRNIWSLSECDETWTHNHLVPKWTLDHFWLNDWAVLWVLICRVRLTVCSYHVTYAFQSESIL